MGPGRNPSEAMLAIRVAVTEGVSQYVSLIGRPGCIGCPPPEGDPVSTVFTQCHVGHYLNNQYIRQKIRFIKRVDKGRITTVKDLRR